MGTDFLRRMERVEDWRAGVEHQVGELAGGLGGLAGAVERLAGAVERVERGLEEIRVELARIAEVRRRRSRLVSRTRWGIGAIASIAGTLAAWWRR